MDWRCSDIKGWPDLREVRAVRRNGASVLKEDMVKKEKEKTTRSQQGRMDEPEVGKNYVSRDGREGLNKALTLRALQQFFEHGPHASSLPGCQSNRAAVDLQTKILVTGVID